MITWITFLVGNHFFKKYYIEFQVENLTNISFRKYSINMLYQNKMKVVSTKWRPISRNESTIILVTLVLVLMIITHTILFVI